jgi:hypothetical protein
MQSIWKSKCVPKIKFFAWLLLNDRLNTRNMLRRRYKHLDQGYSCALCLDNAQLQFPAGSALASLGICREVFFR